MAKNQTPRRALISMLVVGAVYVVTGLALRFVFGVHRFSLGFITMGCFSFLWAFVFYGWAKRRS